MKHINIILISFIALVVFSTANIPNQPDTNTKAHIKFETTSHDFGKITQNGNGKFSFNFTNTGKEPLIIQNVRSSCGCTVASRPNAPIMPGDSSKISVRYDTRRLGAFHKNITVTSNADNTSVVLYIKGLVQAKPKEEVPVKSVNEGFTPVAH
ncbi:MAG: hypothetical protein DRI86_07825 [Bacteroidetes bacterium]|nr:MAG: hypothetical protein DRI86_07825 [Bacteroidota bacterium]